MDITQADLRIGDYTSEFVSWSPRHEKNKEEGPSINIFYTIDIKDKISEETHEECENSNYPESFSSLAEPNLNSIQQETSEVNIFDTINDIKNKIPEETAENSKDADLFAANIAESHLNSIEEENSSSSNILLTDLIYLNSMNSELLSEEVICKRGLQKKFTKNEEQTNYNVSTVVISSEILEQLSENIKKENSESEIAIDWPCGTTWKNSPRKISKSELEFRNNNNKQQQQQQQQRRRKLRRGSSIRHEYRERLRKKAECMREKRKKLYEEESEEERLQRLAREAAKRREMRMYYESPDQRRKRLDAEAARKREYRMYNETPDERRTRLDREAERRRVKRLTMYASETPEQRRERLNRESAKRREARLNQYAKETEDQRQERLRKDALRAREMRFTRSAIETEEERRVRLVKDALRKRELKIYSAYTSSSNFTQLDTVRNFEELNNVQMRDETDNQMGGQYLTNWMMWFQNTLAQSTSRAIHGEETRQQRTDVS